MNSLHSVASAVILTMGIGESGHAGSGSIIATESKISSDIIWNALQDRNIQRKLLASGGSWFIYDVMVYGLGLTAGYIIDAISSDDDNVSSDSNIRNICSKQLIALTLSIPTTIFSIKILPYLGLRRLQQIAFIVICTLFLLMASLFAYLRDNNKSGLFAIYCLTSMSLNLGIGITTFSMPAALFPHDIRSTFNGFAAAMGKTGAILGSYSFYAIAEAVNFQCVLALCSGVAFLGLLLTTFAISQEELDANSAMVKVPSNQNLDVMLSPTASVDRTSLRKTNSLHQIPAGLKESRGSFMIGKTTIIIDDAEDHGSPVGGSSQVISRIEPVVRSKLHDNTDSPPLNASAASHVELCVN